MVTLFIFDFIPFWEKGNDGVVGRAGVVKSIIYILGIFGIYE